MSLEMLRSTATTVAVPMIMLTASAFRGYSSRFHWLLWFGGMAAYIAYVFLAGDWFLFGYYFRFAILAGYAFSALKSFISIPGLPPFLPIGLDEGTGILFAVLFAPLAIIAIRGRLCPRNGTEVAFPMRDGVYCIAEGGNNPLVNHHFPAAYARFALDIVKLDRFGFRAKGLCPKTLGKYLVFGEIVYSPVTGSVVRAVDGIPDMVPPHQDREHPAGNYVMIRHSATGSLIFLAHLQQASLMVREGDAVSVGQPIGAVGNSGITTEPHLHISCEVDDVEEYNLDGVGVPLLFESRFLSRNTLVRSQ